MLRSVRGRVVALTLLVAAAAIGTTAWLIADTTSKQLRRDVGRTLERDSAIHSELSSWPVVHRGWTGIGRRVAQLARQNRRRIALTTQDGRVVADSDRLLHGRRTRLPPSPAAVIGPYTTSFTDDGTGPSTLVYMPLSDERRFPLTRAERRQREKTASRERWCIKTRRTGQVAPGVTQELDVMEQPLTEGCVEAESEYGPSKAQARDFRAYVATLRSCLRGARVPVRAHPLELAEPALTLGPGVRSDADAVVRCQRRAAETHPKTASAPLLLYLGHRAGVALPLDGPDLLGTLVVLGSVLAGAAALALLGVRPIARPITRIAAATRRLGGGDLSHRVAYQGRDEIGQLAASFNRMASSLEAAERSRQRLVSDVAHELRNPLLNLSGTIEAARDGVYETTPALLASMGDEVTHLQRIVQDLDQLAQAEAGRLTLHPTRLDLAELARQSVEALRPAATAKDVALHANGADRAEVDGDPARLRQVLANLLGNAIRHTDAGGVVGVSVAQTGEQVRLNVTDSGCGIPAADLPHIFDRFYRVDHSRSRDTGGSGLGLAIARELVRAHGGTIAAASSDGEGTIITVTLPRARCARTAGVV